MLKDERHIQILREIITHNKVRSSELSRKLKVSEDTIRRDLKELAEQGKIKKVHGGAMASSLMPFAYKQNNLYQLANKKRIAKKALPLLKNGQVVLIDGGTTNLEFVKFFPPELKIQVFTNALPIAHVLSEHPAIEMTFLGGKILKSAKISVGHEALQTLSEIYADLAFIGTRSIHPKLGITAINREEAFLKKKMAESTASVVSLVLSEKIGTIQPFKIIPPGQIQHLITELAPTDAALQPFVEAGVEVI